MKKFIILDRDGVINQDSLHYIKSPDEFIVLPGSIEAIALLTAAGYQIAIATNQSGVSRGYYDRQQLEAIHQKLLDKVQAAGGDIAIIEYCIHLPEAQCHCRKPQPGMLHAIAAYFQCDLTDVALVGDRISDLQAAKAAGARAVMVLSPMTDRHGLAAYPEVPIYHSLLEYVTDCLSEAHHA